MGVNIEYIESLFINVTGLTVRADEIVNEIQSIADFSFRERADPNWWIICFSEGDRDSAMKQVENASSYRTTTKPAIRLDPERIDLWAGYNLEDNIRLRSLLDKFF